jgi:hypothetical protein
MSGLEGLALGHIVIARLNRVAECNWACYFNEVPPICNVAGMDECALKLKEYYNDRDMLKEHCRLNREWIDENYTDEKIALFWKELYEEL